MSEKKESELAQPKQTTGDDSCVVPPMPFKYVRILQFAVTDASYGSSGCQAPVIGSAVTLVIKPYNKSCFVTA